MNRIVFSISAFFFSIFGFSQGIEFEQGTLNEVLEKASQINKPIFIDVHTSWCGPCKKMSKEIFPLSEVGLAYNANFVCYQVDAEKGEGIEIAKKYEVNSYPTYLYIKSDGTIFSRSGNYMEAEEFIAISKKALADMYDPKTIVEWEKEYNLKKNDPQFLLAYMNKRAELGLANAELIDEWLVLVPEEIQTPDIVVEIYQNESHEIKVNSLAFKNLQRSKNKFSEELYYQVLRDVTMNTIQEACRLKDEQLLTVALSLHDELTQLNEFPSGYLFPKISTLESKEEIFLRYYRITGEIDKYLKISKIYCNKLMKISVDSLFAKDSVNLQSFEKLLISNTLFASSDSTNLTILKTYIATAETFKVSSVLNYNAWYVFQNVSDESVLKEALCWSNRALVITPKNPHWVLTNANLYYKLGQKEIAIKKGEQALSYADINNLEEYKEIEDNLLKMKAGEKTWE